MGTPLVLDHQGQNTKGSFKKRLFTGPMFFLSFGEQTQPYLFPMMAILFLSKPKCQNFKFAIQSRSQKGESHLAIEKTELQNSKISKCTLCQNTVPYIIMQLFYIFILICQH